MPDIQARGLVDVVAGLKAKREELLRQVESIDDDIGALEGFEDDTMQPVQAGDFLREPGDFEWIVGGLIARQTVSIVSADGGVGKTTLLVHLGICLSAGIDWMGPRGFHIPRRAKVLYVLAEGSRHAFRNRLRGACEAVGVDPDSIDWHIHPSELTDFELRSGSVERLVRNARADLVFLDTLGYFHGGDENDASEWKSRIMAPLRKLTARYGSAFVLVHHNSKMKDLRGSTAMRADCDHVMKLDEVPLTDHEKQLPAFERDRLVMRRTFFVDKNKYGLSKTTTNLDYDMTRGVFTVGEWG